MRKLFSVMVMVLLILAMLCPPTIAEDIQLNAIESKRANKLEKQYGLQIRIFSGMDMVKVNDYLIEPVTTVGSPIQILMTTSRVDAALSALEEALSACPSALLKMFEDNLTLSFAGEICFADNGGRVNGFTNLNEDNTFMLVLDVDDVMPAYFFHELWHAAEIRTGVVFNGWEELNPEGFQYTGDFYNRVGFDPEWFYRSYGAASALEDRATIYEAYIAESNEWWEAHPRVFRKLKVMLEAVPFAAKE